MTKMNEETADSSAIINTTCDRKGLIKDIQNLLKKKCPTNHIKNLRIEKETKNPYSLIIQILAEVNSNSKRFMVKINQMKNPRERIISEYHNYLKLKSIFKDSEFNTLNVIGYLESPPSLISQMVEARQLSKILREQKRKNDTSIHKRDALNNTFYSCGELLGHYHKHSYADRDALTEVVNRYVEDILLRMGLDKVKLFQSAHAVLCQSYQDFTPANILLTKDKRFYIVDPPDEEMIDYIHLDLARFRYGLSKVFYHPKWILSNYGIPIDMYYKIFLEGYESTLGFKLSGNDMILINAYELSFWQIDSRNLRSRIRKHREQIFSVPIEIYSILITYSRKRHLMRELKSTIVNRTF